MEIKNVLLNGKSVDITITGNLISSVKQSTDLSKPKYIVSPAFYNCHTHLAMNLLRGYADDLQLMDWLQNHIWPAEAHLNDEIVYAGTRFAIMEMIRTGAVFANDMYWYAPAVARAAKDMGIRCAVSIQTIETGGPGKNDPINIAQNKLLENMSRSPDEMVFATIAPHAIYTVSENSLKELAHKAKDENSFLHIHVAETIGEVENCKKEHGGRTPIEYLNDIGLLGPKTIMAHCVHLSDNDIKIIAGTGAVAVENAQSNMKLTSGMFPFKRAVEDGKIRTALGTDGACSNNSLSMFAEMKAASLLAKIESGEPTAGSADKILSMATSLGAGAFGLNAGRVEEGYLADMILLKADANCFIPGFNNVSDIVYAADTACVDTVICNGKILMQNGVIPDEEKIKEEAIIAAKKLCRG